MSNAAEIIIVHLPITSVSLADDTFAGLSAAYRDRRAKVSFGTRSRQGRSCPGRGAKNENDDTPAHFESRTGVQF